MSELPNQERVDDWERLREIERRMNAGARVIEPEALDVLRRVAAQVDISGADADEHLQSPDGARRLVMEILQRVH